MAAADDPHGAHTISGHGQGACRALVACGAPVAPLRCFFAPSGVFWKNRDVREVSSNSENISRLAFLEYKNSRKQELALQHLVNRLVPKNVEKCQKVDTKHVAIGIKQAWNIKNYRYVGDVSSPLPGGLSHQ